MAITASETKQYHKKQRRKAFWYAIKDHYSVDDNWCLSRFQKAFYTIKAVLCLMLHRTGNSDEAVSVAMWNYWEHCLFEHDNGWQELRVGHGVLSNWQYQIINNSSY